MNLIILKNNLKYGLDVISRAIGSGTNQLPIINNVLIKAADNKISLSATNLEVGMSLGIMGKINESGALTVPYAIFSGIVNNLSSERINLESAGSNLIVKTDNYEATIQGISESEFPIIPKLKNNSSISINKIALKDALSKTIVAAGRNDMRPEINGALFVVEPSIIKVVATDSFRLAESKIEKSQFKIKEASGLKIILPLKTAEIVSKTIKDGGEEDVLIGIDEAQIAFRADGLEIISRLIDGKFPDYEAIIPKEALTEVTLNREEFGNALKLASSFAAKAKDVRITSPGKNAIEIYSSDASLGENKYLIPAKISGSEIEIVFNLSYLLDGVRTESSEEIYLGFNGGSRPTTIKTPKSNSHVYIIMPVKSAATRE